MLALLAIVGAVAALFAVAFVRPWLGLLLLLGLLPFNGLLLDVVGPGLHLSSTALTALAVWHDALAGGIVLAAGLRWLQRRSFNLNAVEIAALVVLACGAISLAISPHLQTALYAYRTLYEPICLAIAIAFLARTSKLSAHMPSRYALATVISGTVAAIYAIWQVYVGSFYYLNVHYRLVDGRLPSAYVATFIVQPRAIGSFHSPNEFGAFLMIALVLVATPGLILVRPALRAWAAAAVAFVLLLTFSRSSWVSLAVASAVLLAMLPVTRSRIATFLQGFATLKWWRVYFPPLLLFTALAGTAAISSGLPQFVSGTLTGRDPSSAAHAAQISSLLGGTFLEGDGPTPTPGPSFTPGPSSDSAGVAHMSPFGMGLGTAGAKSARFGEVSASDIVNSETWYVDYLLQAGYVGLLALLGLTVLVARALWIKRRVPVARAALAAAAGLAVGAIFIPVLDEPTVAIPMWALIGLGLGVADSAIERIAVSPKSQEPTGAA